MDIRRTLSTTPLPLLVLALLLGACDDSTEPEDATLVGTWVATSFVALGTDFVADGMGLTITLDASGSYTLEIENDQFDACEPGPDCEVEGTYSSTGTQITLDPGTPDEATFAYSIEGTTMTWSGSISGVPTTAVFVRP